MNNFTMIDLCSKALHKIGANEIVSFDEGSVEAEFAKSIYPVVKNKMLSCFSWSFATKQQNLNKIFEEENERDSDFVNAFMLPNDFLRAVKICPKIVYKICGNKLYTNADKVNLTYIADVDEGSFSPAFVNAFIYAMAAEFSMCLLDDATKFNLFYRLYNSELREARFLDSVQESPKQINDFSLVDVRF